MSNAPSTEIDPWDRPLDNGGGKGVAQHKVSAPPSAIPDDWDEAESSSEEDNQKIWDDANNKAPMPQLVVTSSRTGPTSSSVVVPPPSAFQSPIRILKRTVAPTQQCVDVDSPTSTMTGTFAERSARYNAARERIFANTAKDGAGEGGAITAIVRNPKGPEHAQAPDGQGSQGFGIRVGKRGNTTRPSEQAPDSERTGC